ncbi:PhnD/SsuA/transferrin family substrate-binding protein [Sutterella sp.]|uniref:sensor histidine kinase n=1 Tax=Sutterella sp. TaxID=1981025 RepID=UPI0026DF3CF7|nr:PhnD/SsuA/transferrin family substrate-binding protein [Sutterella sp.]MDO5530586.1 PhnD/SsuA/transferrin family substrate-binding protein [Sutterella sp.]
MRAVLAFLLLALSAALCAAAPAAERPLRIAVHNFVLPEDDENIIEATRRALEPLFADRGLRMTMSLFTDFEQQAIDPETDLILSTAGFVRMVTGVRLQPIATIVGRPGSDANRAEGAAVIVRTERTDLQTLGDLRGRSISAKNPKGFHGWHIVLGEIVKFGADPDHFFGNVHFSGDINSTERIVGRVLAGESDAGFLRLCAYEGYLRSHPQDAGKLRVLDRRMDTEHVACAHSTDLYPGFTLAVKNSIDQDLARRIALALYSMPPTASGAHWDVPTNYTRVDELLKSLKIGPWKYLRQPTFGEFVRRNAPWAILIAAIFLGLLLHSWRAEVIARRRGEQVRALMQHDLEQAERINQMQRAGMVAQLSSLFAHELRQPLASASLYAQGLARQLRKGLFNEERMTGVAKKIVEETERASEIVERVRGYAKGQGQERKRIAVEELMTESLRIWRVYLPKPIPCRMKCPPASAAVTGSPFELGIALVNLLKNAREAVSRRPDPFVSFRGRVSKGNVVIEVADSGEPPADELLRRLGAPASSAKAEGLGLGLSIVSNIIEGHGGRIEFLRGPEDGPTGLLVRVTLPLAPPEHTVAASAQNNLNDNKDKKGKSK